MIDYLTRHVDLNPLALGTFALCAVILACWAVEPWWTKRRRRARVLAERHARVAEDRAWADRSAHAEIATGLHWARCEAANTVARADVGGAT